MNFDVGKVLIVNEKVFRILVSKYDYVCVIELGINKYNIMKISIAYLNANIGTKVKGTTDVYGAKHIILTDDELNNLMDKEKDIKQILQEIYPDYEILQSKTPKQYIRMFAERYNISIPVVHSYIRKYLQSGMDIYSLLDLRKTRSPSDHKFDFYRPIIGGPALKSGERREVLDPEFERKVFEYGFNLFKKGECKSVSQAFDKVIRTFFSEIKYNENGDITDIVLKPQEQLPSIKRFRNYINNEIDNVPIRVYKKGIREQINSDRLRFGNAQSGCPHPGAIVEIDACELDIAIVSLFDELQDVGRPVVYHAVDVYSSTLIGSYVGFENNSFMGASNLFRDLFFNTTKTLNKDGINITPGGIIPDAIRVDHGSEWISDEIRRLGRELGIDVSIVPPAMGSLKGLVESSFHAFQEPLRAIGKKYGAIYKEYDSNHYKMAVMILDEVQKILDDFKLYYNQHLRKSYTLTKDMIKEGVRPIPCELWNYGVQKICAPRYTTDTIKQDLIFALCCQCKDSMRYSITMRGFGIKKLYYISTDPKIVEIIESNHYKKRTPKIEVRYDPRLLNYIWVKVHDEIIQVPLANKNDALMSFLDMTWDEYDYYYKLRQKAETDYEEEDYKQRLLFQEKMEDTMKKARKDQKQLKGNNKTSGIRESRQIEKINERKKTALANLSDNDSYSLLESTDDTETSATVITSDNDANTRRHSSLEDYFS